MRDASEFVPVFIHATVKKLNSLEAATASKAAKVFCSNVAKSRVRVYLLRYISNSIQLICNCCREEYVSVSENSVQISGITKTVRRRSSSSVICKQYCLTLKQRCVCYELLFVEIIKTYTTVHLASLVILNRFK
jgi:hypothetical protein